MQKFITYLLSLATVVVLSVALLSCKDDEPTISGISFELEEQEVTESDGTFASFHPELTDEGRGRVIEVKLVFDHALANNAVIRFDIDGTARKVANNQELNDFEILEEGEMVTVDDDEITILKGATEAKLEILIFEDVAFEYQKDTPFETIILTLEAVLSGPAKLGTQLKHTLKIVEDDAVGILQWQAQDMTPADAKVDMDLIFWLNDGVVWYAANEGTGFEGTNIPAGLGEGDFGISYTYYSGESDNLNFTGVLFNTGGTLNGQKYTYQVNNPLSFGGNYKKVNLNPWTEEGASAPKIAQTMVKTGINYSNISGISPFPEGGSRANNPAPVKLDQAMLAKIASQSKLNSLKIRGAFRK
jgi:hypothetical protein